MNHGRVEVFGPSLDNLHELFADVYDRRPDNLSKIFIERLAASEKKHARIRLVEDIAPV